MISLIHDRSCCNIRTQRHPSTYCALHCALEKCSSAVIDRAAQESGENNRLFCEFMHRDDVPVPPMWRVANWLEAGSSPNPKLQSRIRAFKSDHRS
jgi:hypothetical protein